MMTTTKKIVWFCLVNAESLSKTAVTEIIGVVVVYCLKALFEKREGFGAVGTTNRNKKIDLTRA